MWGLRMVPSGSTTSCTGAVGQWMPIWVFVSNTVGEQRKMQRITASAKLVDSEAILCSRLSIALSLSFKCHVR